MQIEKFKIQEQNQELLQEHKRKLEFIAREIKNIDEVINKLINFQVAIPSWALGTGGTRFGRFPGPGEPRNLAEKMEDAALVHRLTGGTPRISLHIPWDEPKDAAALRAHAAELGLGFDAVNSNTFQDQPGQPLSYKLGSFSHPDAAVRRQAMQHHRHVIEIGQAL